MDIVTLTYRYVNKHLNSSELIKELENIDLSKYTQTEIEELQQLILDIQVIIKNVPNEFDEVEKKRLDDINHMLDILEKVKNNKDNSEDVMNTISKEYNKLLKEKQRVRDGGKLYDDIVKLLNNNSVKKNYEEKMSDEELLKFITHYISVPIPPRITQEKFNQLVNIAIREDKREALWRLAFNYNNKNMDFTAIEDYFIEKRDDYYLVELACAVREDLDLERIIKKVLATKDQEFIDKAYNGAKKLGLVDENGVIENEKSFICNY